MRPTHVETHTHTDVNTILHSNILHANTKVGALLSASLCLSLLPVSAGARPAAGLWNVWEPCVKSPDCGKVLLFAELPPPSLSLPLHASLRCSPSMLSTLQASALPHSNLLRGFACVFERVYVRACPAAHRKWVKSGCQRHGTAASCKTVSMPTASRHSHRQPPQLLVRNCQDVKRWRENAPSSLFCCGCLSLYRVSLALHRLLPLEHKHWHLAQCVHCVHPFEDKELLSGFLCCLPKTTK